MRVVLIGAGIMSATLAVILKELMPDAQLSLYESLDEVSAESSNALNNSGTGHAAYCELNYTPYHEGQLDIGKALKISESFELTKQFWAYLVESGTISTDHRFIHAVPHLSFVWGDDNRDFLRQRYEKMRQYAIFQDMQYSADPQLIREWVPLVMEGRDWNTSLAATKMDAGTDVNFGAITKAMIQSLQRSESIDIHLSHRVTNITRQKNGRWRLKLDSVKQNQQQELDADLVFIGAGGGSLGLLKKTGIPQSRGYGGFPVSGQYLACSNPAVVNRHHAKVYGKADVGAPPMSVPHLDTRIIDGRRILFFGPYAGFTTRFLKHGSFMDFPSSISLDNIRPIISAAIHNRNLTGYLARQVLQSEQQRFMALQAYYPDAKSEDWTLTTAGQRVQIIQRAVNGAGILKFGTEIISSDDGTVAALLGASPGASTSVTIALEVIDRMFPQRINSNTWQKTLRHIIPSYGKSLIEDSKLCLATRMRTNEVLQLN